MAEEGLKADGSKRYRLIGGKHDAAGKKTKKGGMWLRIYPDKRADGYYVSASATTDKSFIVTTPAVFPDEVVYDGETYAVPDSGNEMRFVRIEKETA